VLADNNSTDPGVGAVVKGFERRGMFDAVHWFEHNDPNRLAKLLEQYRADINDYFVYVECDVGILESKPCWLTVFDDVMTRQPTMGMLGSLIDPADFVPRDVAERALSGVDGTTVEALAKRQSPDRTLLATYRRS
jgi:hypothetical protein